MLSCLVGASVLETYLARPSVLSALTIRPSGVSYLVNLLFYSLSYLAIRLTYDNPLICPTWWILCLVGRPPTWSIILSWRSSCLVSSAVLSSDVWSSSLSSLQMFALHSLVKLNQLSAESFFSFSLSKFIILQSCYTVDWALNILIRPHNYHLIGMLFRNGIWLWLAWYSAQQQGESSLLRLDSPLATRFKPFYVDFVCYFTF